MLVGCSGAIVHAGYAVFISISYAGGLTFCAMKTLATYMRVDPGRGSFLAYIGNSTYSPQRFVCSWLYCLYWTAVIGSESLGGGILVHQYLPVPVFVTALILIAMMATLNVYSVRLFAQVEYSLTWMKIAAIILFCLICMLDIVLNFRLSFVKFKNFFELSFSDVLLAFQSVPTIMFSLAGAEIVTIAHREIENASQELGEISRSVTVRMTLCYLLPVLFILLILPLETIRPGYSPFADTLALLHIPAGKKIFDAVIFLTLISCINTSIYVASRVMREALRVEDRYSRTSLRQEIISVSACGSLLCGGAFFASQAAFSLLLDLSGYITITIYAVIAYYFLRSPVTRLVKKSERRGALATIVFVLGVFCAAASTRSNYIGLVAFIVAGATLTALYYALAVRRRQY